MGPLLLDNRLPLRVTRLLGPMVVKAPSIGECIVGDLDGEVESICEAADSIDGPVYCRVLRGNVPRLFDTPIEVGKMRELSMGNDILIVTSGITTEEALRAK